MTMTMTMMMMMTMMTTMMMVAVCFVPALTCVDGVVSNALRRLNSSEDIAFRVTSHSTTDWNTKLNVAASGAACMLGRK
eukprot:4240600-Amphidinium_carterae.1